MPSEGQGRSLWALEDSASQIQHAPKSLEDLVNEPRPSAFLTNSQVMVMLLVHGPHFENQGLFLERKNELFSVF